jgi:hypothetical protein
MRNAPMNSNLTIIQGENISRILVISDKVEDADIQI